MEDQHPEDAQKLITHNLLVVVFDMCSSSNIIEDLTLKADVERLEHFLTDLKRFLRKATQEYKFAVYKFTGDGWILLFRPNMDGKRLLAFLRELCSYFEKEFKGQLLPYLDGAPSVTGLTFGIERGPLIKTVMFKNVEFIGRALNVACRLQGEVKNGKGSPAYKALASNAVFEQYFAGISGLKALPVTRRLRNIRGGSEFGCRKLFLLKET